MKTAELTGAALDWAVAKCEGIDVEYVNDGITQCLLQIQGGRYAPSIDWAQGGPIIEREDICIRELDQWYAEIQTEMTIHEGSGPTPLVAAMRCHVMANCGDEVEIPEELL
jgi:hypothetical protein